MKCPYCHGAGYYETESSYGTERVKCGCQKVQTNFERITANEEKLAEFIYCLQEGFDYYAGNGAKKISQYAMEDTNNKNHIELIHGNRDFDELLEWLKQESENNAM